MDTSIDSQTPRLGSWQWVTETGGRLTTRQRVALLPSLIGTFQKFSADRLWLAFRRRPRHSFSAEDLWPQAPDSSLCRHADEEARDLQSTVMLHHGYRTWVFGAALARIDGASIDRELFHAGSLLHDVGLEHIEPEQCFTRRSAEAARNLAQHAGLDSDRALQMMNGITMHITPGLHYDESPIGYYLQMGAMADLAGIRAWELPVALRERTHQAYPRLNAHEVVSQCWHAEAKAVPQGRAWFVDRYGGFSRIIRWFPVR